MTSNSDNSYIEIPVEEIPGEIKKIVCSPISNSDNSHIKIPNEKKPGEIKKIVCSPNLKHVATLGEDNIINIWSIVSQEGVFLTKVNIDNICNEENGEKIFAVSDNKYVSIFLDRVIPYNFSKLIIFNDTIYEITMWDIETISVKTHILIDWNYALESIEISDDEELLLVCAKNEENKENEENIETRLYIFFTNSSTEAGMNLSSFTTKSRIDRFYLIASEKGERLLYISNDQYNLMDPYNLTNPIDASEFFKMIEEKHIQEPYIIRSDKIIYMIDKKVLIKELVHNNWVKCLRKDLKDTNSITTLPKKAIDIITEILTDADNAVRKELQEKFLTWGLELDNKSDS
ncbi:hypothetical protein F8M41_008601 [Gigaspora margarita]|uniref:Uncharacterized protein n=1 Tax=Gigaspora margarita TaxID=4874 RepID=A0A8H4A4I6_GIGMA|nr:hypothetical protein F8M41_008601 [Gigaspora margarita]